jgi:hypothetical protein
MSLWRRTSSEVAGAWRSVRYDLGRRPAEPPADGPDVTSTGMCTFGGQAWDLGYDGPEPTEMPVAGRMPPPRRPPRRAALVSAFGLLTVIGAAGAYLVVVNGLVPVRDEQPAAAGTFPAAAPPVEVTADSGIGPSTPSPRRHLPAASTVRPTPAAGAGGAATAVPPEPMVRRARPVRTVKRAGPECVCDHPPVPTPTAPASGPSPTPSAPVTVSPSVSPSGGVTFGTPGESPEPVSRRKAGHHRWHH